ARRYREDTAAGERAGVQDHPGTHRDPPAHRRPARRDGAAGMDAAPAHQEDQGKEGLRALEHLRALRGSKPRASHAPVLWTVAARSLGLLKLLPQGEVVLRVRLSKG